MFCGKVVLQKRAGLCADRGKEPQAVHLGFLPAIAWNVFPALSVLAGVTSTSVRVTLFPASLLSRWGHARGSLPVQGSHCLGEVWVWPSLSPLEGAWGLAHCPMCEGKGTLQDKECHSQDGNTLSTFGNRCGCFYFAFGEILGFNFVSLLPLFVQFTELNFRFYEGEDHCICDLARLAHKRLPDWPDDVTEGFEAQWEKVSTTEQKAP